MYKTLRKVVLLFLLTLAVVCGSVFLAACDIPADENGGGEEDAKVTYSVTVTVDSDVEGVTLTSLKAQWKSGSTTAGEETLDAEGKASVELDAGAYTVELLGVPDTATYTKASVTATSPAATIKISLKSTGDNQDPDGEKDKDVTVAVTLSLPATDITLGDDVKVQAYVDGAAHGDPVDIYGITASVTVPKDSTFTVGLTNLPDYLNQSATVDGDTATITLTLKEVKYTIMVLGLEDYEGVTVTLLKGGVAVEDATEVALTADSFGGMAEVVITAGKYTVQVNGVDDPAYSYEAASLDYDADNRTAVIEFTVNFVRLTVGNSVTLTFVDENDEKEVHLVGVEVGEYYAISLSDIEELYTEHNVYITYAGETYTLGKDRIESNEESYLVITLSDDSFTVKADGAYAGAILTLEEYEPPIDRTVTLGEAKEILKNHAGAFNFVAPKYGTYKIEVSGDVTVADFTISMGEGEVIGAGSSNSNLYCEFYAMQNEDFSIDFLWNTPNKSLTLLLTRLPDGDFTLDEVKEVTLNSSSYTKKEYIFKAPVKGVYKLELLNATARDVYVRNEGLNDVIIEWEGANAYGTFAANLDEEIRLGFYQAYGKTSVNAIVTLVEVKGNLLEVGKSVNIKVNANKDVEIPLDGIKEGKEYRVIADGPAAINQIENLVLKYNGATVSFDVNRDPDLDLSAYMNPQIATFTAASSNGDLVKTLTIAGGPNSGSLAINIYLVEIKTAAGPVGPQVGETADYTINGTGISNAAELTFSANFVAGGTYTIKLIPVGQGWNIDSYTLIYDSANSEVAFNKVGTDYFEATFTANANTTTIKVYHKDPYMNRAVEGSVEITAANLPGAGPTGPAVGETANYTINGTGISNAAELTFSENFAAGGTYTIKLIPVGQGWNVTSYTLIYDSANSEVAFNAVGSEYFEATFTANANTTTIKVYHQDPYMTRAVEGSVEITAANLPGAGPAGPAVGETANYTINGTGISNAVELTFSENFAAGVTYTIKLIPVGQGWNITSYTLIYDSANSEVAFNAVGSDYFEATFTANANTTTIKVYHKDIYMTRAVEGGVEITAVS